MKTARQIVSLEYERRELKRMWRYALDHDLLKGGVYDARSASVNVWTRDWGTVDDKVRSELAYCYYFAWGRECRLWCVEHSLAARASQAWEALGAWELAAVGRVVYGGVKEVST